MMGSWRIGAFRVPVTYAAALAVALGAVMSYGVASAYAAGTSPKAGRSIAVSVPPDPVSLKPGQVGRLHLRVVNPGPTPVRVTIEGRGLTLGDQGKIAIDKTSDPLWDHRVLFPSHPITIAAVGYKNLSVKVHMPKHLSPDLYFLGFVVTPIPDSTKGITVINQIGGFFTINIPGPRDRRLAANLELPGWSILGFHVFLGTELNGILHIQNIGKTAVQFWGETDTTATGGSPGQMRIPISLIPSLRERTYIVTGKPAWPIGFVHMQVRIVYPTTTETTTTQIVFTRTNLVINPLVFVVLAVFVMVAIWRRVRVRRRKAALGHATQPRHGFAFRSHRRRTVGSQQPMFRDLHGAGAPSWNLSSTPLRRDP
ncbi:MAG: hypothetical protein M3P01_03335 [Actinomycetota bacterium]|nr:hypothetical protein [Actinomycetota bacterium]